MLKAPNWSASTALCCFANKSTNRQIEDSLSGIAVRADLGLTFFATRHMGLHAGPSFIYRMGSITPEKGDPLDFTSMDTTFNIGFNYLF